MHSLPSSIPSSTPAGKRVLSHRILCQHVGAANKARKGLPSPLVTHSQQTRPTPADNKPATQPATPPAVAAAPPPAPPSADTVSFTSTAPKAGTYLAIAWQAVQLVVGLCQLKTDYWLRSTAAAIAQGAPLTLQAPHDVPTELQCYAPAETPAAAPAAAPGTPIQRRWRKASHSPHSPQQPQQPHSPHSPQPPQPPHLPQPPQPQSVMQPTRQRIELLIPGLEIHVQWDAMQAVHQAASASLGSTAVSEVHVVPGGTYFWCHIPISNLVTSNPGAVNPNKHAQPTAHNNTNPGVDVTIRVLVACERNAVVGAEPHRVLVGVMPARDTAQPVGVMPARDTAQPVGPARDTAQPRAKTVLPSTTSSVWVESLWSIRRAAAIDFAGMPGAHHPSTPHQHNTTAGSQRWGSRSSGAVDDTATHANSNSSGDDNTHGPATGSSGSNSMHTMLLTFDLGGAVTQRLIELQAAAATDNSSAWADNDTYAAFSERFGAPDRAAAWVVSDPVARLGTWMIQSFKEVHLRRSDGDSSQEVHRSGPWGTGMDVGRVLKGRKVANLLGSHGLKALALACLGAEAVTIVDVSPGNARYAQEAATHAHMEHVIRYIVSDVLTLHATVPQPGAGDSNAATPPAASCPVAPESLWGCQDWVIMENGILHYFFDLQALFKVVVELLTPGGALLLRDFHPVSTKLITSRGSKHKVTGDYFDSRLVGTKAAFTKYQSDGGEQQDVGVSLRRWTLGEVVTACAASGLQIVRLDEEPGPKAADKGIPKSFTLLAVKPSV